MIVRFAIAFVATGWSVAASAADRDAARAALRDSVDYFYAGNMRAARIEALNAVKADDRWGLANAMLARVQLALGDGRGAEAQIARAVKAGMPAASLAHLSAHAALIQGDPKRAIAFTAAKIPGTRARAYADRVTASALVAKGDMEAAARAYDAALAADPGSSLLWTDIGRFRLRTGNVGGAGEAAARAVALNPNNAEALLLTGQLVRGQYGLAASLEWFERALELDSANLAALGEAAATLGDLGRHGDMLTRTRRMLAIEPENPRALYLQAVMAARAGRYELARGLTYRIGERMNGVPGFLLLQGVLDLHAGNAEQAKKRLEPIVYFQRANLSARRLYGLALLRAGEKEAAFGQFAPMGDRSDADSWTLLTLASMQEGRGNLAGAAMLRDRASRLGRVEPAPFDLTGRFAPSEAATGDAGNADIAVPRIARQVAAREMGAALAEARVIAERNPGSAMAQMLLGDVLAAGGDHRAAAQAYTRAGNIEFSENIALRMVAALRRSGQGAAARAVLDTFLLQNPRSVPALLLAADDLIEAGRWKGAIVLLEGVRQRIGNRDATLLTGLAWAHYRNRNIDRALAFSTKAYALMPSSPVVAGTAGWIRFDTGRDKTGGAALVRKAARIAPENPRLRDWLKAVQG